MLFTRLARSSLWTAARPIRWRQSYSTTSKKSDSLRILFCGSDAFSCASLQALYDEHRQNTDLIRSIDVVVRPSKPTGRGYKVLKEVPLRALATQLNLPIHVRDTFTGWDMPKPDGDPINLIIAVSFGLFVPPRLIHASKYGGLNVHPSLLPDLRGPAPIHHALLAERSHTGITIQTLSPHAFDQGIPLLQTPNPPGIPIPPDCTTPQLHDLLTPASAAMLVETLRRGLHIPPHRSCDEKKASESPPPIRSLRLRHAPKIRPEDRQILWTASSSSSSSCSSSGAAARVALQARVLGPLWTHLRLRRGEGGKKKRVILEDLSVVEEEEEFQPSSWGGAAANTGQRPPLSKEVGEKDGNTSGWETGEDVVLRYRVDEADSEAVLVQMADGSRLRVGRIKVEGSTFKPARRVLESLGSR
ncbi:Methionyl-tRNA formyltransferase [Chaetomidium leptoderma]|uniref:methionyl-tRNA formyltransferase n=1 Tax=Chaetomidium leptoderma TaxID=669021 RepID=A0AAN6VW75_9PEZI|nr:Methionyl-tRNA formyltransferase [Chaetomidium leptoderma]